MKCAHGLKIYLLSFTTILLRLFIGILVLQRPPSSWDLILRDRSRLQGSARGTWRCNDPIPASADSLNPVSAIGPRFNRHVQTRFHRAWWCPLLPLQSDWAHQNWNLLICQITSSFAVPNPQQLPSLIPTLANWHCQMLHLIRVKRPRSDLSLFIFTAITLHS